jgi:hypothetical protein
MIEHGKFTQGEVSFPVDMNDAHKTFDAVAALSNADKIKLATANNIPTEPFNKTLITGILKSVVQNAWFLAKTGTVPSEVLAGHNVRLERYKSDIAAPVSAVDLLARKPKATREDKSLKYTIDGEKYEAVWKEWRGARYLVIKAMLDAAAPVTLSGLLASMKETRESALPTRNGAGQIIKALIAAGIVTCTNPENVRAPKGSKKTAPTPPVPSDRNPNPKPHPQQQSKKKH